MRKLVVLLLILVVGAVILAPIVMALELDPMPGDFAITWNNQHLQCAGAVVAVRKWGAGSFIFVLQALRAAGILSLGSRVP